jgi:hypothetical protein
MCSDYHASITVYDFLSDVYIGCRVFDLHNPVGPSRLSLEVSEVLPGEGVSDPREWLRDCLLALLEAI